MALACAYALMQFVGAMALACTYARSPMQLTYEMQCVQEDDGSLVMHKGDEKVERSLLEGAADVLDSAMNNPMFGKL